VPCGAGGSRWETGEKGWDANEQHQLAVHTKKIVLAMGGQLTLEMEDLDLQIPTAEKFVGIG